MSHVLVNPAKHKKLRVSTKYSAEGGDNIHFAVTFPRELVRVRNIYPIFVQKDANTGKFFLSALLGFQEGENLFLSDDGWDADYVPISVQRQPFLIGKGEEQGAKVVVADSANAKFGSEEGELLFDDDGAATQFLNDIAAMLEEMDFGVQETDQFIQLLLSLDLLENMTLNITFNEHKKYSLPNLYTVSEDALRALEDEKLIKLYRSGALDFIYSILFSQPNVSSLIKLKKLQDQL